MRGSIVGSIAQIVGFARPDLLEIGGSLGSAGLSNRLPDLGARRIWDRLLVIVGPVKGMRSKDSPTASKTCLRSEPMGVEALRGSASDKTFFKAYVIGLNRALSPACLGCVQAGIVIRSRTSPEDLITRSAIIPVLQVLL